LARYLCRNVTSSLLVAPERRTRHR
jgi:hypothetical protein